VEQPHHNRFGPADQNAGGKSTIPGCRGILKSCGSRGWFIFFGKDSSKAGSLSPVRTEQQTEQRKNNNRIKGQSLELLVCSALFRKGLAKASQTPFLKMMRSK